MKDIVTIQHPIFQGEANRIQLPSKGKLKWIGGNLGLDYPVSEDVVDSDGSWFSMGLEEVLNRLDDFEGYRGNLPIKDALIDVCFTAYEYKQLTPDERAIFESFVRERIGDISSLDAAKRLTRNQ